MATKWTIRKYLIREDGSQPLYPWFVFPPGVTPPDDHKKAFMAPSDIRATFSEALACVESNIRKARTVEVELPKAVERKRFENGRGEDLIVQTFPSYTNVVNDWGDMEMNLRHEELKPLGEYLLALHYEKERSNE